MESTFKLLPETASNFASRVDTFFFFMVALSLFFILLITTVIIFFSVRFRRKRQVEKGAKVHGSVPLEITWSVIPLILSMIMFFWSADLFFEYARTPSGAMEILVTGKQWMWKIQHPNGTREINELHVPLGQTVKLTMTSEDVIHSFFLPAFRVKTDVVPGRYTSVWFNPKKEGAYHLFCAEYCGTEHSKMVGTVYVMKPVDYEDWISGGLSKVSPVQAGEALFTQLGCATCHNKKSGAQGPDLTGVFGTEQMLVDGTTVMADEDFVRESILNPQAKVLKGYNPIMPVFKGMVTETQLMQLIAYIKSLSDEPTASSDESTMETTDE